MQFAEPVLNEIKAMTFAQQSQVMCDLANRTDTPIGRTYAESTGQGWESVGIAPVLSA